MEKKNSATNSATTVVGEHTDLLVLLCLHADEKSQPLFFKSEKKQTAKKNHKVWHINRLKSVMGPELCLLLPFVHAVLDKMTFLPLRLCLKKKLNNFFSVVDVLHLHSPNLLFLL